jgi:hypothetical protein
VLPADRLVLTEILRLIATLEHEDPGQPFGAIKAAELIAAERDQEAMDMLRGSFTSALVAAGALIESHLGEDRS